MSKRLPYNKPRTTSTHTVSDPQIRSVFEPSNEKCTLTICFNIIKKTLCMRPRARKVETEPQAPSKCNLCAPCPREPDCRSHSSRWHGRREIHRTQQRVADWLELRRSSYHNHNSHKRPVDGRCLLRNPMPRTSCLHFRGQTCFKATSMLGGGSCWRASPFLSLQSLDSTCQSSWSGHAVQQPSHGHMAPTLQQGFTSQERWGIFVLISNSIQFAGTQNPTQRISRARCAVGHCRWRLHRLGIRRSEGR